MILHSNVHPHLHKYSSANKVRIFIADDHTMVSDGIARRLSEETTFVVVGMAATGSATLEQVRSLKPDVLLQDLKMPDMSGVDIIRILASEMPTLKMLAMSGSNVHLPAEAITAGARGYCAKDDSLDILVRAVQTIINASRTDAPFISPRALQHQYSAEDAIRYAALTPTELRILTHLKLPNAEIAFRFELSEGTVRNHISNIYTKLGIHSRFDVTAWAERHNIALVNA
jgi:DNA-binding NarL/FixJ family response regulator